MPGVRQHLSIKDAAERLGVSEATVKREIQRGKLAARRVGRLLRIDEAFLQTYLVERTLRAGKGGDRKSRVRGRLTGSKREYAATDAAYGENMDAAPGIGAGIRGTKRPPLTAPRRPQDIKPPFSRDGAGGEGRASGEIDARPETLPVAARTPCGDSFSPAGASGPGAPAPFDAPAFSKSMGVSTEGAT